MTWRTETRLMPDAGFTLIEMIVVLVVLGLALGLVLGRGPLRSPTLETQAAARELAQALRGARAQAIAADRPVEVTLDVVGHAFRVDGGTPHALPPEIALSVVALAGETGAGVAGIRFAPDGSATGGRIDLTRGTQKLHIGVDWLTGRVIQGGG